MIDRKSGGGRIRGQSMRQIIPQKNAWFFPALVLRFLLFWTVRILYRLRVRGVENLPRKGGVLVICNHLSYMDALLLQAACPRFLHFLAAEELYRTKRFGWFLRLMGVTPVSSRNPRGAIRTAAELLRKGEAVCLFPEGQISRTGNLQRLKPGFAWLAEEAKCPVLPVAIDGIWGSVFSFAGDRYGGEGPLRWRHEV